MINSWRLFNFKSVRKETELEFAPLTILAGANSSGKSTILQSILLVAQTLSHKVSSRSVVLNGALAQLGQFDDIRSVDSSADQIVIGWSCQPLQQSQHRYIPKVRIPLYYSMGRRLPSSVSCDIAFDTEQSGEQREITQIQPRLFSSQLSILKRDSENGDQRYSMTVRRSSISTNDLSKQKWIDASDDDEPSVRNSLQYDVEIDDNSLADIRDELVSAEPVGCFLRHFLPDRLSLGVDMVKEDIRMILNVLTEEGPRGASRRYYMDREIVVPRPIIDLILNLTGKTDQETRNILSQRLLNQPTLFESNIISLDNLQNVLRRLPIRYRFEIRKSILESDQIEKIVQESVQAERKEEPAVIPLRPPQAISDATMYLDHFFSTGVRYLGPLRDEPKSLYPLAPASDPSNVGLKGEHTAAVLELYKNRPITFIPTSAFRDDEIVPTPITRTLEKAVVDWLDYLDVAERIRIQDKGKFGHELVVGLRESKRYHDLTHVGVGVSQVLPILVSSLLAEPDTTLIFEQPELHLHPKVQTLLADFFLSMTQLGKQCIIETHSEYLVNRIRFRTAAALTSNPWLEAVKVYFVERGVDGSSFRRVDMNEYGAILEWPEGFFDQSQREVEAILRAATKKRKNHKRE